MVGDPAEYGGISTKKTIAARFSTESPAGTPWSYVKVIRDHPQWIREPTTRPQTAPTHPEREIEIPPLLRTNHILAFPGTGTKDIPCSEGYLRCKPGLREKLSLNLVATIPQVIPRSLKLLGIKHRISKRCLNSRQGLKCYVVKICDFIGGDSSSKRAIGCHSSIRHFDKTRGTKIGRIATMDCKGCYA